MKTKAKFYYLEKNLTCSQAIFFAANDYYNLNLTADDAKFVTGFSGGMGCKNLCGVLGGAVCILGKILLEDGDSYNQTFKSACEELTLTFNEKLGSTLCCELLPQHFCISEKCLYVLEIGCDVLNDVVEKYKK